MKLVPITIKKANAVVTEWHRHNKKTAGGRFALGCMDGGRLVGVAIVGRPNARLIDQQFVAEITRLCAIDGAPKNTCSFLYAGCRRVWQAMGGTKIITYSLQSESGASLRAAGFVQTRTTGGHQWGRPSRARPDQDVCAQMKSRWDSAVAALGH